MLAFNQAGSQRIEVVILSRNDPVSGMRVFRSATHYGLPIVRGTFTRGRPPWQYLKPLNANLFLSAHLPDVRAALETALSALEKLGAWNGVKDRIAQAENVRAALLVVSRGEAPLGIVYATDAAADPNVKIIAEFPAGSHPPIIYPAAVLKSARSADAAAFFDYLKTAKARPSWEKQGFTVLAKSASST